MFTLEDNFLSRRVRPLNFVENFWIALVLPLLASPSLSPTSAPLQRFNRMLTSFDPLHCLLRIAARVLKQYTDCPLRIATCFYAYLRIAAQSHQKNSPFIVVFAHAKFVVHCMGLLRESTVLPLNYDLPFLTDHLLCAGLLLFCLSISTFCTYLSSSLISNTKFGMTNNVH